MLPLTIFYKVSLSRILSLLKIDNAISKRSREVQAQLAPRGLRKDGIAQQTQHSRRQHSHPSAGKPAPPLGHGRSFCSRPAGCG